MSTKISYQNSVPADQSHFDIVMTTIVGSVVMDLYGETAPLVCALKIIGENVSQQMSIAGGDYNYRFVCQGQTFEVNVNASVMED